MPLKRLLSAAAIVALAGALPVSAQPGTSFTYQGWLTSAGSPTTSTVSVDFRLFDDEVAGTQIGSTITRSVTPADGVFSESLDFGAAAFAANQALWLEIEVEGEVLGRQALEASPFALNTRGISVDQNGRIGIGTDSPNRPLHVRSTDGNGTVLLERGGGNSSVAMRAYSDAGFQTLASNWNVRAETDGTFIIDSEQVGGPPSFRLSQAAHAVISGVGAALTLDSDGGFASFTMDRSDTTKDSVIRWTVGGSEEWRAGLDNQGANPNFWTLKRGGDNAPPMLLVDTSGRLGIGTTSPATMLDVNGAVTIRGGADIVEGFDSACGTVIEPGTLMVIDPEHPGKLMPSSQGYDAKVAGIVSGANGVNPGIKLGQDGTMDGDIPVAMTGRVYVKASAENGAIRPGDRLTSASLVGHAMKATDRDRADGAVIGKAMTGLDDGTGMVLVLVNLQ